MGGVGITLDKTSTQCHMYSVPVIGRSGKLGAKSTRVLDSLKSYMPCFATHKAPYHPFTEDQPLARMIHTESIVLIKNYRKQEKRYSRCIEQWEVIIW